MFVDIIHTDGGIYGTTERSGTADFYPNGGRAMPGCAIVKNVNDLISGVCSHNRAVDYYAESVENSKAFIAVAAKSFEYFKDGKYDMSDKSYMGIDCKKS